MPPGHPWKHSIADARTAFHERTVDDFLRLVIDPAITALEERRSEIASDADTVVAAFGLSEHHKLISKANMAFCLSIQSLWEQQLRGYLITCARAVGIVSVKPHQLEDGKWGEQLNDYFLKVRGISLQLFDSYAVLDQLSFLGNACRHGDGRSSRKLVSAHPELWPVSLQGSAYKPTSIHQIVIPSSLLRKFVDAIALFWMDMERFGISEFQHEDPHVSHRIAQLLRDRQRRLSTVTAH